MFKHSPAPWTVCFGTFQGHVTHFRIACDEYGSHGKDIAVQENDFTGGLSKWKAEELKANAYLIAAAPDLLEALKDLLSLAGNEVFNISQKAGNEVNSKNWARIEKAKVAIAKAEGK